MRKSCQDLAKWGKVAILIAHWEKDTNQQSWGKVTQGREGDWARYARDMDESGTKVFSISSPMLLKRKSVSDLGVNTSLQTGKGIYFNGEINFMSKEKGWD